MTSDQTPAQQLADLEARIHIYEGLAKVLENVYKFVDLALAADDPWDTIEKLQSAFGLSEVQSRAALDLQFRRLGKNEQSKIRGQLDELGVEREYVFGLLY